MNHQNNIKKLEDATKLLKMSEKIANETAGISNDTLQKLKHQREIISNINNATNNVDDGLNSANRELRTIQNENLKTKATLFGIGAILTGLIGVLGIKLIK